MAQIKIKQDYLKKRVIFKGSQGKPLGELSEKQLIPLAVMAAQGHDPSITKLFEDGLPPLDELQKSLTDKSVAEKKVAPRADAKPQP